MIINVVINSHLDYIQKLTNQNSYINNILFYFLFIIYIQISHDLKNKIYNISTYF